MGMLEDIETQPALYVLSPVNTGSLSPARKARAIEFIERNIGNHIELPDIASAAALSPAHFCRAFRRTFGMSPMRYLWRRRIEMAKSILREHRLSLTMVALACGFSSASHFSTAFRDATGVTPATYARHAGAVEIRGAETEAKKETDA